jgi:glutamyl-tRNA synthetase
MGGVRTALYAYLFAKHHKGEFILRVEDTDQTRFVPGAEDYIIEALKWTNILPDEGVGFGGPHEPYRQSERKELGYYEKYAKQLLDANHAYIAFDSPADLDAKRKEAEANGNHSWQYDSNSRLSMTNSLTLSKEETEKRVTNGDAYVIRLKVERDQQISFTDMIRGEVTFDSNLVDDKVLIKADGMPTYHLAHIVDDIMMEITHAIRGEEWLPSAPAHILIYQYLGLQTSMPIYAHLPLLLKPEGNGKLSKRDGDRLGFPVFPLEWKDPATGEISSGYREKGYDAHGFVNMLAFLGWNPGTEQEVFSMDELIQAFSFDRVHKAGARFDPEKAKWFNEQYLRATDNAVLAARLLPTLSSKYPTDKRSTLEFATGVAQLVKDRVQFENEILDNAPYLFEAPTSYDEKVIAKRWNETAAAVIQQLTKVYEQTADFTMENCKLIFENTAAEKGIKPGEVLQLFRVIMSGQGSGVDLFGMVALLGKEEVLSRIAVAMDKLGNPAN